MMMTIFMMRTMTNDGEYDSCEEDDTDNYDVGLVVGLRHLLSCCNVSNSYH